MAVTKQPGMGLLISSVDGDREWSSGLMSCFTDCKSCICTYFCLPCMMCRIANRMHECACLPCCVPPAIVAMRTKVRTMGGIQGSICGDCLATSCCGPCAVCQISRELDHMGL